MSYITPNSQVSSFFVSGSQTGGWADLNGEQLVAVIPDTNMSGTQLYWNARRGSTGSGYKLVSGGAHYSSTIAAAVWNVLDFNQFLGVRYLQPYMSGTAMNTGVNLIMVTRPID